MNQKFQRSRFHWLIALVSLSSLAGCTNPKLVRVQPWERAALSEYALRPDRDPLATAMGEHVFFSRESAAGGRGIGGSGCGCN